MRLLSTTTAVRVGGLLGAFLIAGCASQTFPPDAAPDFIILRDRTEFYRFGPLQSSPPDALLAKNSPVKLLRREFGYSLVQYAQRETGYVANDDIIPDPNPPVADLPIPDVEAVVETVERKSDRQGPEMMVDDAPLPAPDFGSEPPDDPAL
jgi:hypothetical protein